MRVLFLHADRFSYRVTGETSITKLIDPIPPEMNSGSAEEVLVCLIAVEKGDSDKASGVVKKFLEEIATLSKSINCARIFLYPYAHLAANLESPRSAVKVLDMIENSLRSSSAYEVLRAPFGVYKAFDIGVKGHPLSELAKTITATEGEGVVESSALKSDKDKKSEWFVVTPDGEIRTTKDFNFDNYPTLRHLFNYEMGGSRESDEAPPHIKLMQEHELVDYEPGSDKGNFRWYPKGHLIKVLLEDRISDVLNQYGAMRVETPIFYSLNHSALAKYLDKFPARQYRVSSDDAEFFLRFAACFGQYLIKHDMSISHRHLPLKLYELTHYSFRREQSGELAGLRRLRTFTMPDMHTLCADMPQAKDEMLRQVGLSLDWMHDLDFSKNDYVPAVRAVREFYDQNPEHVKNIARMSGQPLLLELWDKRYFYFITKFELNFVDTQRKASALSTVQIDVENTCSFDISYVTAQDTRVHPLMLHTSVSGSIDRNVYALLEREAMHIANGTKPSFPFWLAPTQIRLIPVKEKHIDAAVELSHKLLGRVDIDDRSETVGKRIMFAEREWIPIVLVLGDKELASGRYPARIRGREGETPLEIGELTELFAELMNGRNFRPLNLPKMLSLRPIFHG